MLLGPVAGVTPITSAFADDWCSVDPPIYIVTPAGNRVTLHATHYALGQQHQEALTKAMMIHEVEKVHSGHGKKVGQTRVTVTVFIPGDRYSKDFPVRTVISTGENGMGTVYADEHGRANRPMVLRFTLDVP
jgi:hypothetical protein